MTRDQKLHADDHDETACDGAACSPLHGSQAAKGKGLCSSDDFDDVAGAPAAEHYDGAVGGRGKTSQSDVLLKEAQLANKAAPPSKFQKIQGAILPIVVLVIIIGLVVMLFIINSTPAHHGDSALVQPIDYSCFEPCRASLVESMPAYLQLVTVPGSQTTFGAWTDLIKGAAASIGIMTPWLSLHSVGNSTSSRSAGKAVFDALAAAADRGVALSILLDSSTTSPAVGDVDALKNASSAVLIKRLDFRSVLGGKLDATFMVVDGQHFYLGSAELSQGSLSWRKELGVSVSNCSCLAAELGRLFTGYWMLAAGGGNASTPWPGNLTAHFNATMPLNVTFAVVGTANGNSTGTPAATGTNVNAYFTASAASPYISQSMSQDKDAILAAMDGAGTIDLAVADYAPVTDDGSTFWPVVDNAIRSAAVQRQARVRLLVSATEPAANRTSLHRYLASLVDFSSNIQARLFVVPGNVSLGNGLEVGVVSNNNNYLVTDRVAFVGTSDWTATAFTGAFRMGLVANETSVGPTASGSLQFQLQEAFNRDWNSQYALNLTSTVTCLQ